MPAEAIHSLKSFNTFGVDYSCRNLITVGTKNELISVCSKLFADSKPFFVLGGGSNILLTDDYQGTVVKIASKGIECHEDDEYYYLNVEAGEEWHQLVEYCLTKAMPGLENLALIPGTVGAAPIQNIGAYGLEFMDICDWVEFVDLRSGKLTRFKSDECQFGYRESIFKAELKGVTVVTSVGIKLAKRWQPRLSYGPLKQFEADSVTPEQVFDCICRIRTEKLPDPAVIGNAGSFFKNPIVSTTRYKKLIESYPALVGYFLEDGSVKLAAGWLIDNAGLKGVAVGDAAVHEQQALVLINKGQASGRDILQLAMRVIETIKNKFDVILEAEPRIIGAEGERELEDERTVGKKTSHYSSS
ncbi:UDP-N-acetylmuramate dehydrogenase [Shewanella atlantica]|uniref:UDP-N-acetylmuramate dehydrogenase n=1 Tax=Shewanella atlantica TaxID=271099 RepID=UPI003736E47A